MAHVQNRAADQAATSHAILLDTNIWIDNYRQARPGCRASRNLIDAAKEQGVGLCYPVHALKDVFYILASSLKRDIRSEGNELSEADALACQEVAWASVANMAELAFAVGADQADVWLACKYRSFSGDLEDNFVMAAAERAKADFIVTRDEKLLHASSVKAFTPEDALAYLQTQQPAGR